MADKMLGSKPNRRDLLKVGLDATLYPLPFKNGGKVPQVQVPAVKVPSLGEMANGGQIDPPYNVRKDTVGIYKNRYKDFPDEKLRTDEIGALNFRRNNSSDPTRVGIADRDLQQIEQVKKYREYLQKQSAEKKPLMNPHMRVLPGSFKPYTPAQKDSVVGEWMKSTQPPPEMMKKMGPAGQKNYVKAKGAPKMEHGGILKQGAPQTMQDAIKMAMGGKFANETFGDKTLDAGPRSMAEGGEITAKPPGLGRRIAGVFNKDIRTDNRYQMALQKALGGEGSSSFRVASSFTIPTSGQVVNPGERVLVTPQMKSRVVTPGTPAVKATPEKRETVQTGTTKKFTPEFVETGAYGPVAPGAPPAGSTYSHFPAGMNPALKAALEAAIAGKKDSVEWKGQPYKAGVTTEEPVLEERVTPGTPAVAGTPDVTQDFIFPVVRKGGSGSGESFWKKLHSTDLDWINKGRMDSPKGTVRYTKKSTSARRN